VSDDLHLRSATELAAAIAHRELSPVEVVDAFVARFEEHDDRYHTVATPMFEEARAAAVVAEGAVADGDPLGPLHGVPFGIKDLYDTAGVTTAAGSIILADNVPTKNATAVQRLIDGGAIPVAKLVMTEFAGSAHHPQLISPVNPHDPDRTPGGSSSGSGVAVAARLVPFALGSDTVASIRNPAAWNGCVGFKPTWGRISRHGVFPLAASYDHAGPLTTTVADATLVTRTMAGHDPRDLTSLRRPADWAEPAPTPLRVGFDEGFVTTNTDPGLVGCVQQANEQLAAAGASVLPVTIPLRAESLDPYHTILLAEVAAAHRSTYPARADDYSPQFRQLLEQAQGIDTDALVQAGLFRAAFRDAIDQLFTEVDILITPVGPLNAPPAETGSVVLDRNILAFLQPTYLWNLCGAPALALPWGFDHDGLPNSVQIIGPPGHDGRVLAVAGQLESALGGR